MYDGLGDEEQRQGDEESDLRFQIVKKRQRHRAAGQEARERQRQQREPGNRHGGKDAAMHQLQHIA
jgi:hypothetical protein